MGAVLDMRGLCDKEEATNFQHEGIAIGVQTISSTEKI
jgi:hypothetical protein